MTPLLNIPAPLIDLEHRNFAGTCIDTLAKIIVQNSHVLNELMLLVVHIVHCFYGFQDRILRGFPFEDACKNSRLQTDDDGYNVVYF